MSRSVNIATQNLIKRKEGLRLSPYYCSAGKATIGYGTIKYPPWYMGGKAVAMSDPPITENMAVGFMNHDLEVFEDVVEQETGGKANDNEFGAMVSLTYNIGTGLPGGFRSSSVLRLFKQGNKAGAARSFELWDQYVDPSDGVRKVSEGLLLRRREEETLFLTPTVQAVMVKTPDGPRLEDVVPPPPEPLPVVEMPPELPIPQAVVSREKGPVKTALTSKSIMTDVVTAGGTVTGAGALVDQAMQHADAINGGITHATTAVGAVKALALALGGWKIVMLAGAGVITVLVVINAIRYFRKLRNGEAVSK